MRKRIINRVGRCIFVIIFIIIDARNRAFTVSKTGSIYRIVHVPNRFTPLMNFKQLKFYRIER